MNTEKIDHRIAYYIVLDCETCPLDKTLEEVNPYNMFSYDIGWAVVDKRGKVYEKRSFAIAEIFLNEKELMQSAYYANKIPSYYEEIANGERDITILYKIRKLFKEDCERYGVEKVFAHNAHFDYCAMNNTQRFITKSKYRYFLPYGVEMYDTLKGARQVIGKMPTYIKFCEKNGYLTKNGKPRFTAEVLTRYITKDNEFKEEHKGLADVLIEKDILVKILRQHKKCDMRLFATA